MLLTLASTKTLTAQNDVSGELQFEGKNQSERGSGVGLMDIMSGYLKRMNGKQKINLLPGEHR